MKYIKAYEDIDKQEFKKYILIDFLSSNKDPRYYVLRTLPNIDPKTIRYDNYCWFDVSTGNLKQGITNNGNLKRTSKDLIFETDSEEEAIEQLKIFTTSNKYNL